MTKLHFIIGLMVAIFYLSACDKKETTDSDLNSATGNTAEIKKKSEEADKRLKEFENRKIYSALNADIIKTIKDEDLEQAILDYVLLIIEKKPEKAYETVTALPEGFVTVFSTMEVEGEVNNGGFDQYFSNTAGEFALEAIEGFDKIGARKFATITKQALDLSLKEMAKMAEIADPDSPTKTKQKQNDSSLTSMDKLDNRFYDAEENISDLRIKYIREHPDLFNAKSTDPSSDKKPPH